MSSQAEQTIVQVASDTMAENYVLMAALTLLAYDTCLTLPHEAEYIWLKKFKLGTILYILSRYSMLLIYVQEMISQFSSTSLQTCDGLFHFGDAFRLLPFIGLQGLLLARAYAVTDHKRLVLSVLSIFGCFALVLELPIAILDVCDITSAPLHTISILNDIITIAVILFDMAVVAVTITSTLGTWRIHERSTWDKRSLTHLLAQQSFLRIGFVLTITVAEAILPLIVRSTIQDILGPVQNSLSVIIICRFHLILQRRNAHPNTNTSQDLPTISVGSFRAATQRMHDAVMAEFGDSGSDGLAGTEMSLEDIVPPEQDLAAGTTDDDITLEEVVAEPRGAEAAVRA